MVFKPDAWQEVGDTLWDAVINDGKDSKAARQLGSTWRNVLHALLEMKAERNAVMAVSQLLAALVVADSSDACATPVSSSAPAPNAPSLPVVEKESSVARFFGLSRAAPVKGMTGKIASSVAELKKSVQDSSGSQPCPPPHEPPLPPPPRPAPAAPDTPDVPDKPAVGTSEPDGGAAAAGACSRGSACVSGHQSPTASADDTERTLDQVVKFLEKWTPDRTRQLAGPIRPVTLPAPAPSAPSSGRSLAERL
ncbi:uncharacterized protein LOC135192881 [Pogoniulus pusillus]|uniref:uncharacterized protein LOC135192881 n=1 Tax=Pogoniulus pusillus TaxID=488313 RepID=UPI0030B93FEE